MSGTKLCILMLLITCFKLVYNISVLNESNIFSNFKKWPKFEHFAKIEHKIADQISKYLK